LLFYIKFATTFALNCWKLSLTSQVIVTSSFQNLIQIL